MKFYRRFGLVAAISFDLDDTLYSNSPIMQQAESKMIEYFANTLAEYNCQNQQIFNYDFWLTYRQQVLKIDADLIHDVTLFRQASYALGMQALGMHKKEAEEKAKAKAAEAAAAGVASARPKVRQHDTKLLG